MRGNFIRAVGAVLDWEGGYVNNPDDPGGETKYGISKRSYPSLDISEITKDQAKAIYRRDYWDACKCDDLPAGIDLLVFDAAVNQGPDFAACALQEAVGVYIDGIIGPRTLEATKSADTVSAMVELVAIRGNRYGNLKDFDKFGFGWMRRLADMHQLAMRRI